MLHGLIITTVKPHLLNRDQKVKTLQILVVEPGPTRYFVPIFDLRWSMGLYSGGPGLSLFFYDLLIKKQR